VSNPPLSNTLRTSFAEGGRFSILVSVFCPDMISFLLPLSAAAKTIPHLDLTDGVNGVNYLKGFDILPAA
jgi:hypothetical protein